MELIKFDALWDYQKPAETAQKFLEIYAQIPKNNSSYQLQLMTQIARTHSLQHQFEDAHEWLHKVELALDTENEGVEHLRFFLEKGRTFNTSGKKELAMTFFSKAFELGKKIKEDFHTVDAAHMLAIVSDPAAALMWNEFAIQYAEDSTQERAKNWLGSLYNNLGWSFFDLKNYEAALAVFEKGYAWQLAKEKTYETYLAKWCIARVQRALNNSEIALNLLKDLEKLQPEDGFMLEEIAENLYILNKKEEAKPYFLKAYEMLSKDIYLQKSETPRLERLLELGK